MAETDGIPSSLNIQSTPSPTPSIPPDAICRICRGIHTENKPLYHPCQCSGSIKYIHQQCLEEWLEVNFIHI